MISYHAQTKNRQAERLVKDWAEVRRGRRLKKVVPLTVAKGAENFTNAGTSAG